MTNPDKPAWLVPISRVVHHAIQPGTIRVKADTAAEAIALARSALDYGHHRFSSAEYEPVSEIQDASSPEIADDLEESDVLPVDDTPRAPSAPRARLMPVQMSRAAAEALMTLATEYLVKGGDVPQIHDPADVAAAQHFLTLGLRDDETIRALREPIQAEGASQ
jgi:hypothetical protein